MSALLQSRSGPHLPPSAGPGLRPTVTDDIAPCAVLTALYLIGAIANQTLFQSNRRKGHMFAMSWAMFGFCMARVATLVLRLAWATRPDNASLGVASLIFMNVGILVIYVVDLLLALRIFRALHPRIGWSPYLTNAIKLTYVGLGLAIILVISFTILAFYTFDVSLLRASLWIQRAGTLYIMLFNLIAPAIYLLSILLPPAAEPDDFGRGSMRSKIVILGIALFFTLFISGYRTGVSWSNAPPLTNPAWYDSRVCFYLIEIGFEIIILYLYLLTRFDLRYWVPNGSNKPGDYHTLHTTSTVTQGVVTIVQGEVGGNKTVIHRNAASS